MIYTGSPPDPGHRLHRRPPTAPPPRIEPGVVKKVSDGRTQHPWRRTFARHCAIITQFRTTHPGVYSSSSSYTMNTRVLWRVRILQRAPGPAGGGDLMKGLTERCPSGFLLSVSLRRPTLCFRAKHVTKLRAGGYKRGLFLSNTRKKRFLVDLSIDRTGSSSGVRSCCYSYSYNINEMKSIFDILSG